MNANSAPAKTGGKNLAFTSVRAGRCTAYGVVRDSKGNTFDIEIKGTDEKAVRKFIRYELKQAKQGKHRGLDGSGSGACALGIARQVLGSDPPAHIQQNQHADKQSESEERTCDHSVHDELPVR